VDRNKKENRKRTVFLDGKKAQGNIEGISNATLESMRGMYDQKLRHDMTSCFYLYKPLKSHYTTNKMFYKK
jgi:hypothetical protein